MKTLHLPRCHRENFIFSLKDNVVVVCDFVLFFCWFWFFFFPSESIKRHNQSSPWRSVRARRWGRRDGARGR